MDRTTTLEVDETTTALTTEPVYQTADNVILFHAAGINTAWNKTVAAFIETGQLLLKAKKEMSGTGKWSKLFDKNIGNLPFGIDTAEGLMNIAKNEVLSNSANWRNLPPSIRTLAVLSKVRSPKKWETWLADGSVTADTELKRAEELVGKKSAKPKAKKECADSDTSESDAADTDDDTAADTAAITTTATNGSKAVLESYEHFYALACDHGADWSNITTEMVGALTEEMKARLIDTAARVLRNKEWEAN